MSDTEMKRKSREEYRSAVKEKMNVENIEAVPRLEKIVVNVGIGDASENVDKLEKIEEQLTRITGQRPRLTRARKSIANFEVRAGDPQGLKIVLRRRKMIDFLRKLIHLVLPRTKDFRGLDSDSFDGQGNYSLGLEEQGVFPEISYEETETFFGMDITIVTTAESDEAARALLEEYNFPFES